MYAGDYYDALEVLLSLEKKGFQTSNIRFLIGECYLNIPGLKSRSVHYLKEAVSNISVNYNGTTVQEEYAPPKALLYMGIACRLNNDFDSAIHYFNEYLRHVGDSDTELPRLVQYHIERCNFAREMMAAPAQIKVDTPAFSVASVSSYNPLLTPDEKELFYMERLKFYNAVMISQKNGNVWSSSRNLTPHVRSDGDHNVTGISADGKTLLFTFYDPYNSGDIYASEFINGEWTPMYKMEQINTVFNETHASFGPDGKEIYFTSDRKGGYGGTDIYKIVKNEQGGWGRPVNLGPLINTPYNEETPFVSADGTRLFFSSQGHYNMGGYDIFCSSSDSGGNWLPPVNVGYPLNTTDDDIFFFPVSGGNAGYMARFTENSFNSGLIRYQLRSFSRPERFMVNGKIDVNADEGFDPSVISVRFIENMVKDTVSVTNLNQDGTFRQKLASGSYKIEFADSENTLLSKALDIPNYFPHNNLIINDAISVAKQKSSDTVYLNDILFGFNAIAPGEESATHIETIVDLIRKYPEVKIKISGYTDAIGSELFNMKLSQKRAESVKEILEKRVEKSLKIFTVPCGESNPVARNKNADGTDNPEGRRYNRRVEIHLEDLPDTMHIIRVNIVPDNLRHK